MLGTIGKFQHGKQGAKKALREEATEFREDIQANNEKLTRHISSGRDYIC